jgi:hypothetical protein
MSTCNDLDLNLFPTKGAMHGNWCAPLCAAALIVGCSPFELNLGAEPVQESDAGGSTALDASSANALQVHIELMGQVVERVTLSCPIDCLEVEAMVHGGTSPYAFEWEDHSQSASRRLCPESSTEYQVTVHDESTPSHLAQRASLTVEVPSCSPEAPDGGCSTSSSTGLAELATLDPKGSVSYFGAAELPAGKYRVEYVDGCMTWGPAALGYQWSIHAGSIPGQSGVTCQLVGATRADSIATLPGTAGTGYLTYEECVAANEGIAPLEFEFRGGKLGVWSSDFNPADNIGGEGQDRCGTSPIWKLSRLSD